MSDADGNLVAAEQVVAVMQRLGMRAVVIGAIALAAHRYVRYTDDIDLGVDAELGQMRELAAVLAGEGLEVEFHEPDGDDPLGGVLDVSGSFGSVQVINFGERFPTVIHDALAGETRPIREGSELRIVPITQLVALKLYAGGAKSKADIIEMLRRNPEADLDEIRAACARYRLRGLDEVLDEL